MINYQDFSKLELKIAKIKEVEEIEGADKLLALKIDLGDEERQIVAGIKKNYTKEGLIGKEIVIVANLEPVVLKGVESQGMLLAADSKEGPVLLAPEKEVNPGSKIK